MESSNEQLELNVPVNLALNHNWYAYFKYTHETEGCIRIVVDCTDDNSDGAVFISNVNERPNHSNAQWKTSKHGIKRVDINVEEQVSKNYQWFSYTFYEI